MDSANMARRLFFLLLYLCFSVLPSALQISQCLVVCPVHRNLLTAMGGSIRDKTHLYIRRAFPYNGIGVFAQTFDVLWSASCEEQVGRN